MPKGLLGKCVSSCFCGQTGSKRHWLRLAIGLLFCSLALDLSAAASTASRAGNPYIIDFWTTDDGLPHNTVTSIIQSQDGYLWLGTRNGLVRFDGMRFVVFDESTVPGLGGSQIVRLFQDRQSRLWIGTETAGVVLIRNGQVKNLGIGQNIAKNPLAGAFERRLASVAEDSQGSVWLYTADGQLWRYEDERFSAFLIDSGRPSVCRSLIIEKNAGVWVGTDGSQSAISSNPDAGSLELPVKQKLSMAKLDFLVASQKGGYWRMADGHVQKCVTNRVERDFGLYPWGRAPVSAACEDREGNLVVGTLGVGVFWFGPEGQAAWLSSGKGLSYDVILSLCVDREGNLWVGTDGGGLNRVKRQVFEVLDVSQGAMGGAVQSVCEDDQGGLYIGSNGGGLAYWKEGVLQRFGPGQGLASDYVWSVFVDQRQQVWAGTWGAGLFQLQNGRFQRVAGPGAIQRVVSVIHQDRGGRLWLGTQNGLASWDDQAWKVYSTREGLSSDEVRAIADDAQGNLWVGTAGGGLNRLKDGRFTSYHKQDGLPGERISALHVDRDGVVWVGTSGGGLGRFQEGRWTRYTTREGLVSNSISYLVEDSQGSLWIGSNAGIMRVQKRELNEFARGQAAFIHCRAYSKADGLPARECTTDSQPGGCFSREGQLWFPTTKGLVSVRPELLKLNPHAPPVVIETVLIDGQSLDTNVLSAGLAQPVIIPAGKERLEIHFTGLNLGAPDKARFKYRLEPHETQWIEAGNSRVAGYSKVPPGRYRFQVQACNEDGVWNETGSTVAVVVQPPLWRTWWFLSAASLSLLGAIIAVVHNLSTLRLHRQLERLRQQESLQKERSRIAQDIHDQLGASLTQVSLLGELVEGDKDHPEEVEAHARQISQTARDTTRILDEIVWAVNPSNDTLDGLVTYVCKYAQDFLSVAGLKYRLEVPDQLPGITIPPDFRHNVFLTFKESLTNIVKHARASSVQIRLKVELEAFSLEIEDNGCGVAPLDEKILQTRNGLRGMRKRMETIGGRFTIGRADAGGTVVRLAAPLNGQKN